MTRTRIIGCKREFAGGAVCNRPVSPVFGVYPEECTACACRVMVNTSEGREVTAKVVEQAYSTLRSLVVAGSVAGNPWKVDGLILRQRFRMLDQLVEQMAIRRLMRGVAIASRLSEQRGSVGRTTGEIKRTSLGSRWAGVSVDRAIELRKAGFKTRFIGVEWQVEVS